MGSTSKLTRLCMKMGVLKIIVMISILNSIRAQNITNYPISTITDWTTSYTPDSTFNASLNWISTSPVDSSFSMKPKTKTQKRTEVIKVISKIVNTANFEDIPPYNKTTIYSSVHLNNLTSVSSLSQEFTLDLILHLEWTDPRFNNSNIRERVLIPDKYYPRIWIPDVSFSNGKSGRVVKVTDDNKGLYVGPNATMEYTYRAMVTFSCLMDFHFYPMDTQLCEMQLESWSYNTHELQIEWKNELASQREPFTMDDGANASLPQYHLTIAANRSRDCQAVYTSGRAVYDCLELDFVFRRELSYYYLDIYVPSSLIVLISFIGLFIDYNVVPSRVNVGTLSINATIGIIRAAKSDIPQVAYPKASDVWLWACQLFTFFVFLEFGVVNVLNRMYRDTFDKKSAKDTFLQRSPPAKTLDKLARIIFPGAFLLFTIVYWSYYLSNSGYHERGLVERLLANKPY